MLERIWSGWRSSYVGATPVRAAAADGPDGGETASIFSQILRSGEPDSATHIVHRGTTCFVIVNIFPYTSGHQLVIPYREVADLEALTSAETAELWAAVTDAVRAVKVAYGPDGVNVGINLGRPAGGSVSEHLHVHVVPRWTGDANFMTAVANTRTLPEPLADTAAKLRAAWPVG